MDCDFAYGRTVLDQRPIYLRFAEISAFLQQLVRCQPVIDVTSIWKRSYCVEIVKRPKLLSLNSVAIIMGAQPRQPVKIGRCPERSIWAPEKS